MVGTNIVANFFLNQGKEPNILSSLEINLHRKQDHARLQHVHLEELHHKYQWRHSSWLMKGTGKSWNSTELRDSRVNEPGARDQSVLTHDK